MFPSSAFSKEPVPASHLSKIPGTTPTAVSWVSPPLAWCTSRWNTLLQDWPTVLMDIAPGVHAEMETFLCFAWVLFNQMVCKILLPLMPFSCIPFLWKKWAIFFGKSILSLILWLLTCPLFFMQQFPYSLYTKLSNISTHTRKQEWWWKQWKVGRWDPVSIGAQTALWKAMKRKWIVTDKKVEITWKRRQSFTDESSEPALKPYVDRVDLMFIQVIHLFISLITTKCPLGATNWVTNVNKELPAYCGK